MTDTHQPPDNTDIFFYKESENPYGVFSNFYLSTFIENDISYTTSEQHFMANKARYFKDDNSLQSILKEKNPDKIKVLGRKVNGFDKDQWSKVSYDFMLDALWLKFTQNKDIRKTLLDTNNAQLYEAAPNDSIWGIGCPVDKARGMTIEQRKSWKQTDGQVGWGRNLLGKALMEIRTQIREELQKNPNTMPISRPKKSSTDPAKLSTDPNPTKPPTGPTEPTGPNVSAASGNNKKATSTEIQNDIVDLFGETYYLGDDKNSVNKLSKNDGKLVPLHVHFDLVRDDKALIYTKEDFIRNYGLTKDLCEEKFGKSVNEVIEICKKKLSVTKIIYKNNTKIQIDSIEEKQILIYILNKRIERIGTHQPQFLKNLSEIKRPDILKEIIDDITKTAPLVPINDKQLLFLLYYAWQTLHKDSTIDTAWDKTHKDVAWQHMIDSAKNMKLLDVFEALKRIKLDPTSNSRDIKAYIDSLIKALELHKITLTMGHTAEKEANAEKKEAEKKEAENDIAITAIGIAITPLLKKPKVLEPNNLMILNSDNEAGDEKKEDDDDDDNVVEILNENENNEPIRTEGGGLLPPAFFANATKPIIQHLQEKHPIYSFITDIPRWTLDDTFRYAQQLHHICTSITNEKQYGFYRIKHIPSELLTHINHLIACTQNHAIETHILYHANRCNENAFLYFLCLDGNISFTDDVHDASQKKEQRAVRKFFKADNLYLLYTPKREVNMSYYMKDPYFAYDINYNEVDNDSRHIHIRNVDTLLNRQDVPLANYLTVETDGIVDLCQLELSLVHQLNHLIVV